MSQIKVSNLTFAYEGSYDNIFENVSFSIDTNWKLGFTGRNGRGKTTFLKLLLGEYEYKGKITSSVKFEYFPYPVSDMSANTSDILLSISPETEYWMLVRELNKLEVDENVLYRPFETLSNGERTKALLAGLFSVENGFLLIDEPTNHLDMHGRETVADYLNTKSGFILVSHDRAFLDACVDHILSINRTSIEIQKGNFSSWYANKELKDAFEEDRNLRLKKDIKKLKAAAQQAHEWADKVESTKIGGDPCKSETKSIGGRAYIGEQSRRMQQRRKNLERRQMKAIEEKSKLLKDVERSETLKMHTEEHFAQKLVRAENVSVVYGKNEVLSDLSFTVERGERVALCGRNGSGKSSVLKLILGENIPHTGTVNLASGLKISYISQDTSDLFGNLSDYAKKSGIDETIFKTTLRKLGFSRVQFEKDMSEFSGGQKKKVLIAKSLCEDAQLFVWDEPMNFIDVISRIQIEELILNYEPTMLFVEHDKAFVERIATKRIEL